MAKIAINHSTYVHKELIKKKISIFIYKSKYAHKTFS